MDKIELELIRNEVEKNLNSIERRNADVFREFLYNNNFTECPASLNHHESYDGGLMVHSHRLFTKFWEKMDFYKLMDRESAIMCSYGHDVCKLLEYQRNNRNTWVRNHNKKKGHGLLSIDLITDCGITLSDEEDKVIRYHMGGFYANEFARNGYGEYAWADVHNAIKKYASVQIFASTDMEVSRWIEENKIEFEPDKNDVPTTPEPTSIPDTSEPKSIPDKRIPSIKINIGK